jgi:hypothetical protein
MQRLTFPVRKVATVSEFTQWLQRNSDTLQWLLALMAWVIWWLWAVNWTKAWAALAQGAWVGLVLLVLLASMVWSHIDPSPWIVSGIGSVSSSWACLSIVCGMTALALFCGWLQGVMGWTPAEVELEPAEEHALDHGHGH